MNEMDWEGGVPATLHNWSHFSSASCPPLDNFKSLGNSG